MTKTWVKPTGAGSKFFKPLTPAGFDVGGPAATVAHAYNHAANALKQRAKQHAPAYTTLKLQYGRMLADGTCEMFERGEVQAVPSFESKRPGLHFKKGGVGGEALDDFMAGGVNYDKAPDVEVWQYVKELFEEIQPSPQWARTICDEVAVALGVRCGLDLDVADLPHPLH